MRWRVIRAALGLTVLLGAATCTDDPVPSATQVTDITLTTVDPGEMLPGSLVVATGGNFLPDFAGPSHLVIEGALDGQDVRLELPLSFVDYDRVEATWPGGISAGLPADSGVLTGTAYVTSDSILDGLVHQSAKVPVALAVADSLTPHADLVENAVLFVNDLVYVDGANFLLGGDEGETVARLEGCFTPAGGSSCDPVPVAEVPTSPTTPFDRTRVSFPFAPSIAGIRPGTFSGSVTLINRHSTVGSGAEIPTDSHDTQNDIIEPAILAVSPQSASLGQFVQLAGGGFVGTTSFDPTSAFTNIELSGTFSPDGEPDASVSLNLVGEFVSGQLTRYVLNEEDQLGQAIDLRKVAGSFTGTATPVIEYGSTTVTGSATPVSFNVGHVKQVVWVRFLPSYTESLRRFGLRAVDAAVRQRALDVVNRDFRGANVELRTDKPDDFALFAEVEIHGPDPNGIGLLGYDNTPGKDDGNIRLYDKIGGVNALTQQDGYPGYGGVFVESMFGFSLHPGALAEGNDGADAMFDQVFDPFRPDVGGQAVAVGELASFAPLTSGGSCPAVQRSEQIACAVWALGTLIGTTVSHELAHSFGLADPYGSAFHNSEDTPGAIMDPGYARSFRERAELAGEPQSAFCLTNYQYLRSILPTDDPDPLPDREDCF